MKTPMLCPACSAELPDDYPYDHVAIDRALTTDPDLFTTMKPNERREVVLAALSRGTTISALAAHLTRGGGYLRSLLPAEHFESAQNAAARRAAERTTLDRTVRGLWQQRRPDTEIALRTGYSVYVIADVRRRLGLPTHSNLPALFSGGVR